jgi:hypothetical protein
MPDLALLYDDLAETYAAGRHLFDTTPILEAFAHFLLLGARLLGTGGKGWAGPTAGVGASSGP